ncbi:flagellar protein FlgN [Bacillus tuaregi]|uniref:flagellar protein FlgN n=1 Tax=Bacillus tuaregi TaxID=1816695 RepID=UPI0008F86B89|nr:flagellar protein FlgN [Bacillus tuaregi]
MSANHIITSLEQLLALHEELFAMAKRKTDIIKAGNVDELRTMTNEERKFTKTINETQKALLSYSRLFLLKNALSKETPSLRDCLPFFKQQEKERVTNLQARLVEQVTEIQQQNDLNQQLLEQSLAFVNMSLDLLKPDHDSYNYERPNHQQPQTQLGRSLFDSNA